MKRILLLISMSVTMMLSVVGTAAARPAANIGEDGGGVTCNSGNVGATIYTWGPAYGLREYQCRHRDYSPDQFVYWYGAYWVVYTYGPTWYYVNVNAWFPN